MDHLTRGGDLALLVGYAGTGKSALLGVARSAWEAQGYRVRGAALSPSGSASMYRVAFQILLLKFRASSQRDS